MATSTPEASAQQSAPIPAFKPQPHSKATEKELQRAKPVEPRKAPFTAENLSIASAVASVGWSIVGVALRMPTDVILAGTSATGSLSIWQSLRDKFEGKRSRRREKEAKHED